MVDLSHVGVPLDAEQLASYVAIQRLQSAYADVITRRAFGELEGLFLADCVVTVDTVTRPPFRFVGPQEFGDFVGAAVERFDHFEFVIQNSVIDLGHDLDRVTARIHMCEIRHDRDADPVNADPADGWSRAYGRYHDTYRRVDGRWWFAERSYRSRARTGIDAVIVAEAD